MRFSLYVLLFVFLFSGCEKPDHNPFDPAVPPPPDPPDARPGSIGILGDPADVQTTTKGGLVIMGGGADVDAAFQWMISRRGGDHQGFRYGCL